MRYQLEPVQARCPVCFSVSAYRLYTVSAEQAAQHFVLKGKDPARHRELCEHIESLWGQSYCSVVTCAACQFGFSFPFVAGDSKFYRLAFSGEGYPPWKWEFQVTLDTLKKLFARDFTLLEVGAGNGAFVRAVAPVLTPKQNIVCTEFSNAGRRAITDYGISCLDQDVRVLDLREYGGRFDVVCMFQVLEHMDSLDQLFRALQEITCPGAHLFIGVPDASRIQFNELNGALLDMPPNHIGRWQRSAFEALAGQYGWTLQEYRLDPGASYWKKVKTFMIYRYLRLTQDSSTTAHRIEQMKNLLLRRALQMLAIPLYGLGSYSALFALGERGQTFGQWVHMSKQ